MKNSLIILFIIFCVSSWSQAQQNGKAILTFERIKIDLGKVSSKEKHLLRFPYENTGNTPLIITGIDTSCGCVVPVWSKKPLLPGQTDTIYVHFNPATKRGTTINSLYIKSNAENKLEIIRVYAQVR